MSASSLDLERIRRTRFTAWLPVRFGPSACEDDCCWEDHRQRVYPKDSWSGHLACFCPTLRRDWRHAEDEGHRPHRTFSCLVMTDASSLSVVIHDDDDDFWQWEKKDPRPGEAEAILRWLDGLAILDLQAVASRLSPRLGWTGCGTIFCFG